MIRKLLFAAMTFVLIAAFAFAGGSKEATASAKKKQITVGFSFPFIQDSPYTFPYAAAARKLAADRNWNLILTNAKGDLNTQSDQIESMVAKGVDGIMIMPLNAKGIVPVIKRVYKETNGKLPMIASNVMPDPAKLQELVAFTGPNSYLEGKAEGEYWVKYMKDHNITSVNYVEADGTAGYSASIDRNKGFLDAIKAAGAQNVFHLLDRQPCNWDPDKAQAQMENWITTYGKKIQMVYSENDGMATGIVKALQEAGYKPGQVLVSGNDGQTAAVQDVKDGWMLFTVFQSPVTDAQTAISTMAKILNGEKVPYYNYMDTPIIDKSNVDHYLPIVTKLWGSTK